jgi:ribose/xylose/arabinose/galactoside ABC-type transport system permease subunit
MPVGVSALVSIAIGAVCGFMCGFIISKLELPSFIISLAFNYITLGVALIGAGGAIISAGLPGNIDDLSQTVSGVPLPVVYAIIIVVVFLIVQSKTVFAREVTAIGANSSAARLSGIKTEKIKILTYVICGFLCGIAGIVMTGRVSSGQPAAGNGMDMTCLTAVVIGGVSMTGGEGKTLKALFGVMIISVLSNGLTIMNVGEYQKMIVEGLIFLFAVCFDSMQNMMAAKKKAKVQAA